MSINDNLISEMRQMRRELDELKERQFDIIDGIVNLGADGNIKFDPTNNKISIGPNGEIELKTNGTNDHEIRIGTSNEIRLRVDGTDIYATFGTSSEIKLDAKNKKILVGTSGEIELDAVNKRIEVGGTNVVIDGGDKVILVNDGSDDRVLIGYDLAGF